MLDDKPLTTGEVARYCHVTRVAVWKWIKKGKLQAYRLPGGHHRIQKAAVKAFLEAHGMPIDPQFFASAAKRILVVDDEPTTVEIVVRALQRLGDDVEIATASDGFEAGLQVATFKPDLLVLDLMMPHVDGFEVCRILRQNPTTEHIRILIITAYGIHENVERVLKAGADDLLHKPLDIQQLTSRAMSLLSG